MEQGAPDLERGGVERGVGELGHAARGVQPDVVGVPHQANHGTVRDGDALGHTGRARGVDHISQVVATGPRTKVGRGGSPEGRRFDVDDPRLRGADRRQQAKETGLGEDHRLASAGERVEDHQLEAGWGIGGIEGHVSSARLEDGEHAHHHAGGALDAEPHPGLRPDPQVPQLQRHPVGALVQLSVAQALVAEDHGGRVRGALHLPLEQLVDTSLRRVGGGAVVPFASLVALGLAQEGQVEHAAPGRGHAAQEALVVGEQALDGGGIEQVGRVLDDPQNARSGVRQVQGEVELGGLGPHPERDQGQAGELDPIERGVLQGEHDLEQRRPARIAANLEGVDQLLEGDVLMGVGAEGRLPHAGHQLADREVAREVQPQDQGVDEKADQRLDLAAGAVGNGSADADHLLPRGAAEQGLEAGQEDHEQRRFLPAGELPQRPRQASVQGDVARRAAGSSAWPAAAGRRGAPGPEARCPGAPSSRRSAAPAPRPAAIDAARGRNPGIARRARAGGRALPGRRPGKATRSPGSSPPATRRRLRCGAGPGR